uniref:Uncharacterized protein n=1 Tax=Anguilla anguilla TaxID=7936 RepID=A0A0E9VK80_ANGAN
MTLLALITQRTSSRSNAVERLLLSTAHRDLCSVSVINSKYFLDCLFSVLVEVKKHRAGLAR